MNIQVKRFFWLAIYFLSPIIPITLIATLSDIDTRDPFYILSMVAGVTAFVWLVNQFVLSARPRFVERDFGMDRLYRFHTIMAVVCLGLALLHNQIKEKVFEAEPITGQLPFILLIVIAVFSLIFLVNSILLKIKPVEALRRFVLDRFQLKRPLVLILHNLTAVALVVLLIHVLTSTAAKSSPVVSLVLAGYFLVGAAFYIEHKFLRKRRLEKNAYRVLENTAETNNIRTLKLAPQNGRPIFSYKPGQFVFITIFQDGIEPEAHPFSLSSSPTDKEYISVTVKALGDFTASLKDVRPGAKVHVEGPYGYFSYENYPRQEMVCIAGGIGITPILSMLRHLSSMDKKSPVTLLWGVQKQSDLIRWPELQKMQAGMPQMRLIPILSNETSWDGEKGYLDQEKLQRLAVGNGGSAEKQYYVCGPARMMDLTIQNLTQLGVARSQIHYERFAL